MKWSTSKAAASWLLQCSAVAILLQTLFFKLGGAGESIFIFTTLGVEPWGRFATAFAELIASVLLLIPRTVTLGALLSLGLMGGAILSHLTKLGIVVRDDGGLLFALALIVAVSSAVILFLRRHEIPILGTLLAGRDEKQSTANEPRATAGSAGRKDQGP